MPASLRLDALALQRVSILGFDPHDFTFSAQVVEAGDHCSELCLLAVRQSTGIRRSYALGEWQVRFLRDLSTGVFGYPGSASEGAERQSASG